MESAFGWLGEIFRALLSLVPRLIVVRQTHGGVRFARGKKVKALDPGLHWVWPAFDEYEVVPLRRQTTNLDGQYLVTKDGRTVAVGGIVVYEISCVESLLTQTWDYEDTIRDLAQAAIKGAVSTSNFTDLLEGGVDDRLTEVLSEELEPYGVEVIRVTLSDFSPCIVLANWGGS